MSERYRLIIRETGGPEVIMREPIRELTPGRGEILIRQEAVGLNFIDTYQRSGLYALPLPSGLGSEGAGVVEAVGEGVGDFRVGDRVGCFSGPVGAYATHRIVAAERAVAIPGPISSETAAAIMLKGCTAEYLIERCARVKRGDTVLVHAAAGGVGSILVPWLKAIGATVIAHAGSAKKAERAGEFGADHALSGSIDGLAAQVRTLTDGEGVAVVFDGVGAASWTESLASVAKRGLLVTYGNASGPVPPFRALDLTKAGSIFVTRPTLADYISTPEELRASAQRLFEMVGEGYAPVHIGARYSLTDAAHAHRDLEARATTGSAILLP
ncbi:quinone oxidoreductase family protein [Allosphingosinicella sp.]|uniref:quinone oxidoreductase family protein n=1 Tax=Allosphingosinicella sp. TaxID=2823234 RepID=UPI002FC1E674